MNAPGRVIDADAFTWHVTPPPDRPVVDDIARGFHPLYGPAICPLGHFLGPGTVLVSWVPCDCQPALAARTAGWGHQTWRRRACADGKREAVCHVPPHRPGDSTAVKR